MRIGRPITSHAPIVLIVRDLVRYLPYTNFLNRGAAIATIDKEEYFFKFLSHF